jgi:hypothetical protein
MAFKPLKDDQQLREALELLSRLSERCALATEAVNRHNRSNPRRAGSLEPASKLLQEAEAANRERRNAKQQILTLVNERMSTAYTAGLQDGTTQAEMRGG